MCRFHNIALSALACPAVALALLAAPAGETAAQAAPANWNGFYAGLSGGGRFADNSWATTNIAPNLASQLTNDPQPSASFDDFAPRFGLYAGYNWTVAPAWIAGIEADLGWAPNKNRRAAIPGTMQRDFVFGIVYNNQPYGIVEQDWDASLRARVGFLVSPDTLVFATGGVAWQAVKLTGACTVSGGFSDWCTQLHNESHSDVLTGWTLGGGIERMAGNWLVRADYRYADFGTFRQQFFIFDTGVPFDDRLTANVAMKTHTFNIGVAYRFGAH